MMGVALAVVLGLVAGTGSAGEGAFALPDGVRVDRWIIGPDGIKAAIYVEPLPAEVFCGGGLSEMYRDLRRVRVFDREGRRVGGGRVPPVVLIIDAFVQPAGFVVLWAIPDRGARVPTLFRVGVDGIDPSFQPLKASDLGGVST